MNVFRIVLLIPTALLMAAGPSYQNQVEQWRKQHQAGLIAADGWTTVAGLFWLKEGENRCGSDPASDVLLPAPAPARAGVFEFHNGKTRFQAAPGVAVAVNGKPARTATLSPGEPGGKPDQVVLGDLTMFVIQRGDRYGIRLRDKNSSMRKEFRGLRWFPVKQEYRIVARFTSYPKPRPIAISNVLGQTGNEASPGYATFTLGGKEYRLDPIFDEGRLQFVFRDLTAGKDTYPAGRFLYADLPKDGKVLLDFNKAENPPCAFTPYATCPLPPRQNRLPIRIEAGELNYGHH